MCVYKHKFCTRVCNFNLTLSPSPSFAPLLWLTFRTYHLFPYILFLILLLSPSFLSYLLFLSYSSNLQSSFSILIFIPPCSHLLSHLSSPNFLPLIASFLTCTLLLFIPPFFPTLTLLHLIPFPLTLTILLLIPASFNLSPSHLPLLTFFSHLSSAGDT